MAQVIREVDQEVLHTVRVQGTAFTPPVYTTAQRTVRVGIDRPDQVPLEALVPPPDGEPPAEQSVQLRR